MEKIYRWGIIGAGNIAAKFCDALCSVRGAEVYAVASRDEAKARDYAKKYSAKKIYTDYESLMQDENVDIVYIATPHILHHDQTMMCLHYGKHVLCEKPLSVSYDRAAEMIAMAKEKNLFLMEGMWTSCMPFLQKIREWIREGKIGKIKYLQAQFGFHSDMEPQSRLWNKNLGGGSVLDVGIYPIYLATALLDKPDRIQTFAKIGVTGVDEYANIIMQYGVDTTAHLLSSITFKTSLEASIIGEKGQIRIYEPWFKSSELSLESEDNESEKFSQPHRSNGFEHEIEEVIHCLKMGYTESKKMPHEATLSLAKIMDEVLWQSGYQNAP